MAESNSELIAQRERSMDRAERALDKAWPERKSPEFVREMQSAASDLERIAGKMRVGRVDSVEQSRVHRYLGSIYSDLAPALGKQILTKAKGAYQKAEELLEGCPDALERAKLEFNFGNTLRQIDPNDAAQLREAERRLVAARGVFVERMPQQVASADQALEATRYLLKVAPVSNAVEHARADMQELGAQLEAGGDVTEIAAKMKKVRERQGGVTTLFTAVQGLVNELPDSAKQSAEYAKVQEQMKKLMSLARGGDEPADPAERNIMRLLGQKLSEEVEAGRVSKDRAATLATLLENFGQAAGSEGEDIQSAMARLQSMRELAEAQFANLHYMSHGIPRPPEGSRAADLVELWWVMRLYLLEEVNRFGKSQGESKQSFDLNVRAADVDKRIYEAGGDDARATVIETEAMRPLAEEIRRFAARHHPLLASPIWPSAKVNVDTNAVFFSGATSVRQRVARICKGSGLAVAPVPRGASVAAARWRQLQSAYVTVFDLSVPEGPELAAVSYDLGIALTLGKPVVVLAQQDQAIPFDVDLDPVLLSGSRGDAAAIAEAIDRAAVWTMPRPQSSGVPATIEYALRRAPQIRGGTYVEQTLKQLGALQSPTEEDPDPVAADSALRTLVGFLGQDGPMLLHPVWPPAYPEAGRPRLFHVMPFRPKWANAAAASVEEACVREGVHYVRGDRVADPNVIRSIWMELNRATHVLVDLTDFNANVGLELGIAHVLGRPTLMVGRGKTVKSLFPMIAKQRIASYRATSELGKLVQPFLS